MDGGELFISGIAFFMNFYSVSQEQDGLGKTVFGGNKATISIEVLTKIVGTEGQGTARMLLLGETKDVGGKSNLCLNLLLAIYVLFVAILEVIR